MPPTQTSKRARDGLDGLVDSLSPALSVSRRRSKGRCVKNTLQTQIKNPSLNGAPNLRASAWLTDYVTTNAEGGHAVNVGEPSTWKAPSDEDDGASASGRPALNTSITKKRGNDQDEPQERGIGVRVAAWWEDERRSYAGTVSKYDPNTNEYLVEYEDDDSQAWHPWEDLHVLPSKPGQKPCKEKRIKVLDDIADGLLILAQTVRGANSREDDSASRSQNSDDSGLLALSQVAQSAQQEPIDKETTLKIYAQRVEKEVNAKLESVQNTHPNPQGKDAWFTEMKDLVSQAIHSSRHKLGGHPVITTISLG